MTDETPRPAPELLAPAGDWDSLRAAAVNGADAVYFGLEAFNARRRATNFTLAALPEVMRYLHDRNVKGYVAFNTLIFPDELSQAVEYAARIAESGADAVIVQDLGLIRLLQRLSPSLSIHASTQATQTEPRGIEMLRSLGVSRVILARELTLPEIARLAAATPMALEVFVHGAMCISYSGQCLASESLWGRSANRGLCAQACRLPYQLMVDGRLQDLGERRYLLSPQDLAAHDRIPELVQLGIAAFKIEGRLKSAHYVAATTRAYRSAIDAVVRGQTFSLTPEHEAELTLSFSRGSCRGFLDGIDHRRLVHGRFPKKRGLLLGTVVGKIPHGVVLELPPTGKSGAACLVESRLVATRRGARRPEPTPPLPAWPLKPGDGVVFDEGHPDQDEQGGRLYGVRPAAEVGRLELTFGRDDVNLAAVSIGSRLWKTDDPAIRRRLESSYRRDLAPRRIPLRFRVRLAAAAGSAFHLAVTATDDHHRTVDASWDQLVQPATKHALTVDLLRGQFARLGNTPFELHSVELVGPDGPVDSLPVMVPKSVLNDLRRSIVQLLLDRRAAESRHAVVDSDALEALHREVLRESRPAAEPHPRLHILARTVEQLEATMRWKSAGTPPGARVAASLVYIDFPDSRDYPRAVTSARAAGNAVAPAAPRVLMPGEEHLLDELAVLGADAVLVRNLGSLDYFRRRHSDLTLIGDHSLNSANEIAVASLLNLGLSRLTPSHDLSATRLFALLDRLPPARLEIVLHQHMPMFHTRHCLLAANLAEAEDCPRCRRGCFGRQLHLRDRLGIDHPLLIDFAGRNTVFNAAIQSAAELVPGLLRRGVVHFRVELLRESPAEVTGLLEIYAGLISGCTAPAECLRRLRERAAAPVTPGTLAIE